MKPGPKPRVFNAWEVIGLTAVMAAVVTAVVTKAVLIDLDNAANAFDDRVEVVHNQLSQRIGRTDAVLTALVGLHHASDALLPYEFSGFSSQLLEVYPFIQSVVRLTKVTAEGRADYEQNLRDEGFPQFQVTESFRNGALRRAGARAVYFPIEIIQPLEPEAARLLGYDAISHPALWTAIGEAIASGRVVASKPHDLIPGGNGFFVLKAVYRGREVPETAPQRRSQVSGLIALHLSTARLFHDVAGSYGDLSLSVHHGATGRDAPVWLLFSHQADLKPRITDRLFPTFVQEKLLDVHGEAVVLRISFQPGPAAIRVWLVSLMAILAFIAGASLVLALRNRRLTDAERKRAEGALARSKQQLELRVRDLEKLQQRLEAQAHEAVKMAEDLHDAQAVLSDAIESTSEGFALWDADDRLIMCNDRYRRIYPRLTDIIVEGISFEEFTRIAFRRGVFVNENGNVEASIRMLVDRHRRSAHPFEQRLGDGRWIRVSKRQTKDGRIVGIITDISEQKRSEATIERMAMEDDLTGLPNRVQFQNKLRDAIANSNRTGHLTGLMLLDLDQFKHVNDTLGHPAGDTLLKKVALRVSAVLRDTDTFARLGGDEFAVIATNVEMPDGIGILGQRILDAFTKPFVIDGKQVHTSTSIGATIYPHDWGDTDQLLRNADLALYRAKEQNGGICQLFDEQMHAEVQARCTLEEDLRKALDRDEFHVVYQPQIAVATGEIVGAEALLRWTHPERGAVSPAEFIPIAETTRLIIPISEWVLRTVCAQVRQWQDKGLPSFHVSINVSPVQFKQHDLVEQLLRALTESGLDARWLELEITEGMAMNAGEETEGILARLKALGFNLAIDDFGTGYSSLNRLKRFPIDRLKIDQTFVRDITTDWNDATISAAVIRLGHSLNIEVIAEGVETVEQLDFLAKQGCDQVQGYLFSRPLRPSDFEAFLDAYDPAGLARLHADNDEVQRPGQSSEPKTA